MKLELIEIFCFNEFNDWNSNLSLIVANGRDYLIRDRLIEVALISKFNVAYIRTSIIGLWICIITLFDALLLISDWISTSAENTLCIMWWIVFRVVSSLTLCAVYSILIAFCTIIMTLCSNVQIWIIEIAGNRMAIHHSMLIIPTLLSIRLNRTSLTWTSILTCVTIETTSPTLL